MSALVSAMLVIVAIIHLLPVIGAASPGLISRLYGIAIDDPEHALLLRHRAVLFGLVGAFLVAAALVPALQLPALIAGAISVVSFLAIAGSPKAHTPELRRVIMVDWVALACLLIGAGAWLLGGTPN